MAGVQLAARYERVPYPSRPHPSLHPERLAATAHLLGLRTASVERCRVLEVGCSDGAHLLPLAAQLPGSTFLGVDVAAPRIEEATAHAAALGLANVTFEVRGLEELGDGEPFDYVLAHGIYSWIEPAARDALLALCSRRLAPDGVALVSYNTFPGWYLRHLTGGVLARFGRGDETADAPSGRVDLRAGRRLLGWTAEHAPDGAYATLLRRELDLVREVSDSYLFHDHLAPLNEPSWFLDFVQHAGGHQLRYLGEARLVDMSPERYPRDCREAIAVAAEGDLLRSEQLMDLVEPRYFRRTLLCHAARRPCRDVGWRRTTGLRFAVPAAVDPGASWGFAEEWEELGARVRAALAARAPQSASFGEIARAVASGDRPEGGDRERLGRLLLSAVAQGWLLTVTRRWPVSSKGVRPRPLASPLARRQLEVGLHWVTNQRHEAVTLDQADRLILARLDGRTNHRALAAAVAAAGEDLPDGGLAARLDGLAANALLL